MNQLTMKKATLLSSVAPSVVMMQFILKPKVNSKLTF